MKVLEVFSHIDYWTSLGYLILFLIKSDRYNVASSVFAFEIFDVRISFVECDKNETDLR